MLFSTMLLKVSSVILSAILVCEISKLTNASKLNNVKLRTNKLYRQSVSNVVNTTDEICDQVCDPDGCTLSYCKGGVCCTKGSPDSFCCPLDHRLCVPEGCCPDGHPLVCGDNCCTVSSVCCGDVCCDRWKAEYCCHGICCDGGATCCGGKGCCPYRHCYGETCCPQYHRWCGVGCCSNDKCCQLSECCGPFQSCCGQAGCKSLCPSLFEIYPCPGPDKDPYQITEVTDSISTAGITTNFDIYRVLRAGELCSNMTSEDPNAESTVENHILCQPNIKTRFLAFTSNLTLATIWFNIYKAKASTAGIAQVSTNNIPANCTIYNLTDADVRSKYLKDRGAVSKAAAQSAILVEVPSGEWITGTCVPLMEKVPEEPISKDKHEEWISEFEIKPP